MFRFKTSHLCLLLGLAAPGYSVAAEAHYCIAVNGGFGHGGTTFIGTGFAVPSESNCVPWSGFTKAENTVVLTTTGTGCLSSDGKKLTVSVSSADPMFFSQPESDYITLSRTSTSKPFGSGQDTGAFSGSAEEISCTSTLLKLPATHD